MADGTKAVVDTSVADEAALAMALGDIPDDTPDDQPGDALEDTPGDAPGDTPAENATDAENAMDVEEATGAKTDPEDAAAAEIKAASDADPETETETATGTGTDTDTDTDTEENVEAGETADPEEPAEATAPLSATEIAAELAAGAAGRAAAKKSATPESAPSPAAGKTPDKALDKALDKLAPADPDTGALPVVLPAPLRHSGDKIAGRYRLEECITQAETFSSWRAVDEKLRRAVGVHLLAAGHQRAKSVLAAAKAAALLGDPRFVQVLDAVQEGELVYVIREWLPGATDLAQLLADGPMEPYNAYQMARQVTDAIAAAHRRGQAHLRLTPRCVLRTETGQYRINGIAVEAALRGLPDEAAAVADTRAIGALLYAALTHRWPYPEDRYDLQGLPRSLGCVPPDQVKAGVHKGLSEIAARALCEHPPHHQNPITSPEQLAKAIALMPKIRQPEPPAPPAFTPPRYTPPRAAQTRSTHSHPTQTLPPAPLATEVRPRPRRRMRRLLKWTASTVALAAIGVASWQLVTHLNGSKDKATSHPGTVQTSSAPSVAVPGHPLTIAGVQQFNALGDGPEHAEEAARAIDGDPATVWQTSAYNDDLGGSFKEGTGLLVDLGSVQQVGSVHVQFLGNTKVELRAAPKDATAPPVSKSGLNSLGTAVAKNSGTEVDLNPEHPLTTRYLLIWLTSIPKDGDGRYRGQIAEIKVTG
ncbi:hypothetical protein GCM10010193_65770 [Kitasatospora atroaurantiaca]|uniref:Protein kinase domain-containing protein n=1 Tax=Kitasatospora atroaurantiaca TaxID=285545 RepID=A0A561ESJ7_9ACTN|nr:protein kinase family protein [Kitasatospora atroaurantiaca]TWE18585.1 hypothetical protein FB465_3665 [Kitasatospora atroaurantiaca]